MKRILSLLLALTLVFALVACSNEKDTSSDPDSSTPTTQTESTDTNDTQTSETDTTAENSGDAETPSNSNPTGTETSKPTASDKGNTTSSKPSNTPSTPTTSTSSSTPSTPSSSTTTPSTPSHTHSWSDWKTETKALIGRDGIEKRTCSSCKETESRTTTNAASSNSFYDEAIKYFLSSNYMNEFTLNYISYFAQEYEGRNEETIRPSFTTVVNWLSSRFVITDSVKAKMKQDNRYDSTSDTFILPYENAFSSPACLGYIHNGGNKYTVYYQHWEEKTDIIKVELEYNLLDGKPNKYLLIEPVNSVPNNIIQLTF